MTKELGQRIRAERTARKMTQEELAERADLHPTYIGQVERGEKSLTIASLEKIVEGLAPAAHKAMGGPIDIIIGPQALAGRISMELPERPRVFVERNLQYSPWIHADELPKARIIEVMVAPDPLPEGLTRAYGMWAWRPVHFAEGEVK